ncbi:DUF5681 domain-containing protein [Methylobacterium sp. SD21]|uniref:DUF5681 domain-containing protein n=1 Tax=Methylobacterium litchii TaxID=3138810 RepID=UPI00313CE64F
MPRKQNEPEACKARGFKKGSSGNPKGRPPINREIQEMCRELTPKVVERLFDIAMHGRNDSASVQAATQILDRAWGRPKQSVDVKVDHNASGLAAAITAAQDRLVQRAVEATRANTIEGTVIEAQPVEVKP